MKNIPTLKDYRKLIDFQLRQAIPGDLHFEEEVRPHIGRMLIDLDGIIADHSDVVRKAETLKSHLLGLK
jgi:hypothetical protein